MANTIWTTLEPVNWYEPVCLHLNSVHRPHPVMMDGIQQEHPLLDQFIEEYIATINKQADAHNSLVEAQQAAAKAELHGKVNAWWDVKALPEAKEMELSATDLAMAIHSDEDIYDIIGTPKVPTQLPVAAPQPTLPKPPSRPRSAAPPQLPQMRHGPRRNRFKAPAGEEESKGSDDA